MNLEFNKELISNFDVLLQEIERIRESKNRELDIEYNKVYQLQRIADELNSIRFVLEDIKEKRGENYNYSPLIFMNDKRIYYIV